MSVNWKKMANIFVYNNIRKEDEATILAKILAINAKTNVPCITTKCYIIAKMCHE